MLLFSWKKIGEHFFIIFRSYYYFHKFENQIYEFESHSQSASFGKIQLVHSLNCIYVYDSSCLRFPHAVIFAEIDRIWRHSEVTCDRPIGASKIPLSGCEKLIMKKECKVWWRCLLSFWSYRKISGGGAVSPLRHTAGRGLILQFMCKYTEVG